MRTGLLAASAAVVVCVSVRAPVFAGTPPPGFQETIHVTGIFQLTGFDWSPNGDLWIIGKDGRIRVLRSGSSTPTFIRKLSVDPNGERGLVGLAVDPDYAVNLFMYFYYTALTPTVHNRVSRFHEVGDSLQDETILLEGPTLDSGERNSGGMRFGLDGRLYIAMGDNRARRPRRTPAACSGRCCGSTRTGRSRPTTPSSPIRTRGPRYGRTASATRTG